MKRQLARFVFALLCTHVSLYGIFEFRTPDPSGWGLGVVRRMRNSYLEKQYEFERENTSNDDEAEQWYKNYALGKLYQKGSDYAHLYSNGIFQWLRSCSLGIWSIGYGRFACNALDPSGSSCCLGAKKEEKCKAVCEATPSLATAWFGKDDFRAEEAFKDAFLDPDEIGTRYNPFLGSALISPRPRYLEGGSVIGCVVDFKNDNCPVNWGLSIRLPYRVVRVSKGKFSEENLSCMIFTPTFVPDGCPTGQSQQCDYGVRLDFIRPLIRYSDGSGAVTGVRQAVLGANGDLGGASADTLNAYVIYRDGGVLPQAEQVPGLTEGRDGVRMGKIASQVSDQLGDTGSGVDGETYFFGPETVNYDSSLGQDAHAQRRLFLVPRINVGSGGAANTNLADSLELFAIRANTDALASEFLQGQCDVCLKDGACIEGLGDLTVDFYVDSSIKCFDFAAFFGVVFPTGKAVKDPKKIYAVPTGNNRHFEITFGGEWSWNTHSWCRCFKLKFDTGCAFAHVFRASEQRLVPFEGATIRGIGSCQKVDVSWNRYQFFLDCTINAARDSSTFVTVGYELFGKTDDNICLNETTVADCFGRNVALDSRALECRTDILTHKLRTNIHYVWNNWSWSVGGSKVFAGKNGISELALCVGITTNF